MIIVGLTEVCMGLNAKASSIRSAASTEHRLVTASNALAWRRAVQKRVFVGLQLDRDALRATDTGLGEPGLTTASHHGRVYSTLSHVARPPLSKAPLT